MICKVTKCLVLLLVVFGIQQLKAQVETSPVQIITVDSFVVHAVRDGLNVQDFVQMIQEDTTFYRAFQNLRRIEYDGSATVRMFNEDHLSIASYSNRMSQFLDGKCRWMQFPFEVNTGDFFDKHKQLNYYTAGVFSYIFLYRDTICGNIVETDNNAGSDDKLELRKEQLKTLIFNPGRPVNGIPLIGDKMEIFSPEMQQYYDYTIAREKFATGVDCFVFTIKKKPEAEKGKDVVINELTTWFDVDSKEIVARNYQLSYFTSLFDFDVSMKVRMGTIDGYRVPVSIKYSGYWDIPFRDPEIGNIDISVWGR
ncbi:MAG TPA: hypothetical protein PK511_04640 [Chitinophagales bacterium]|nr:hypothetical protein [Chitinophagales bacterium]HMZ90585.1 hypothetical protein [Chitinophagales bacterium]HNA56945.1 hypothetical protein [Chitinophagales bacterium]HNE45747.1 hypothetical protein [Chitinophagales bacterium]HNF70728.1 hypothetical protein [Chitinophagales bacterium]